MPPQPGLLSPLQTLLTTLVVKLALVALLAIVLVRYHRFRAILLTDRRAWPERLIFAVGVGIPIMAGVVARLLLGYKAADITLEVSFTAGLIAGTYTGGIVGFLAGFPPLLVGEFGALPFAVGCGFAGGALGELCPRHAIWNFSPFVFTSLHERVWKLARRLQADWQLVLFLAPVGLELLRLSITNRFGVAHLFSMNPQGFWPALATILATVLGVAIPIKVWNNARIEHRLEEQEKLLMAARIEALSSQINPHFLFNALNSISSLIRSRPETARELIAKLSNLLRDRLNSHEQFVTLREELQTIDRYLDIEIVRFGPQLRVEKQIQPEALETIVPSMILQPLVENSIKHGLTSKIGGGTVTLRAFRQNGRSVIEVADNGMGMTPEELARALTASIGLSNVNERLKVTYGDHFELRLTSEAGRGTCARLEIPEITVAVKA
ncbi:MAG TPA: histidine kinase [Vicinamibacterales bacterium]|nr:histidine kinase [Vicinamibacterales bacterium]